MTDRRDATTLASRRRCGYCGQRCYGRTCLACGDLGTGYNAAGRRPLIPPLDPHRHAEELPRLRDELREAARGGRQ